MAQKLSITPYDGKIQDVQPETPIPMQKVRLERGRYGMKLDIVREGNFFQRMAQKLEQVELHPLEIDLAFLFAHCVIGFWSASYAIFIRILRETSFQPETIGRITTAYHFYGIDGNTKAIPLGVARHPSSIQTYLRSKGIAIDLWHPIHELPDHLAESTAWTGYTIHACLLRMQREQSHIVLVQGE